MHDEFIREQIQSGKVRDVRTARTVTGRIAGACWPGGIEDRLERGALAWLRRWRPASSAAAALPVCSCRAGRCAVCN
jgi:hypothetical protein